MAFLPVVGDSVNIQTTGESALAKMVAEKRTELKPVIAVNETEIKAPLGQGANRGVRSSEKNGQPFRLTAAARSVIITQCFLIQEINSSLPAQR